MAPRRGDEPSATARGRLPGTPPRLAATQGLMEERHNMMERLRRRREQQKGFTLIELLVVVIIIGLLAAIAIPAFMGQRDKANDAVAKSLVRNTATAVEAAFVDTQDYERPQRRRDHGHRAEHRRRRRPGFRRERRGQLRQHDRRQLRDQHRQQLRHHLHDEPQRPTAPRAAPRRALSTRTAPARSPPPPAPGSPSSTRSTAHGPAISRRARAAPSSRPRTTERSRPHRVRPRRTAFFAEP